jgi:hypothetical protein
MSDSFDTLLKQIESTKKNIVAFSPTLQKDIELKPLTIDQQSVIIDSISDISTLQVNPIYLIVKFNTNFNNIIKDNVDKDIFHTLTTVDRVNIILYFRNDVSDSVELDGEEINLQKIIDRNRNIDNAQTQKIIEKDGFKFDVSIPKLSDDSEVNRILAKKIKENPSTNSIVGDIYLYEILKFVNSIQFEDGEVVKIQKNYKNLQLLKKINLSTLRPVIQFIEEVRTYEEKFINIPDTEDNLLLTPDLFII